MKATNHWAVLVAAVVFFALGALWYTVFSSAVARRHRQDHGAAHEGERRLAAPVCRRLPGDPGHVLHAGLDRPARHAAHAGNGALTGATVAFGFIGATLALNYGFEARGVTLWLINAGYVFVGLVISGAIIGAWRKQAKSDADGGCT